MFKFLKSLFKKKETIVIEKQEIKKQLDKFKVGTWTVKKIGEYYKAYKMIDGKQKVIYIGKEFNELKLREKIVMRGLDI